ncbi:hypothetical protein [Streptomyces specialis]|uniref:hypothetical protein n=1 Tax=Streptomyces specialis TaxID=498367 RepID=UPI00073E2EB0|nr:hypothetical protein [Streptomyces specialis]
MTVLAAFGSFLLRVAPGAPAGAGAPGEPAFAGWPVPGAAGAARPLVARGWDPPPAPWSAGHRGVDLTTAAGAPAAAPGRRTLEPVRAAVAEGAEVAAGEVIGSVAAGGPFHCDGPCLHWGLLRGETYVDPLSQLPPGLLGRGPSRLLPTEGVPVPSGAGSVPVSR